MKGTVFLALLHHPVYDKNKDIIKTSITNFDIHDIARSCRTFGIEKYILIHPTESQRFFAQRIIDHWKDGYGSVYNKTRKEAFSVVEMLPSLEDVLVYIKENYGSAPTTIATSAKQYKQTVSYPEMRNKIENTEGNYLIILGSGWGLHEDIMENCSYILEPINGPTTYNHLSVRAAGAIILDRLLGI